MNRGSRPRRDSDGREDDASMRPRFMNRGSTRWTKPIESTMPSFNEAPIHESGKYDPGHGFFHASCASMRPRFMNRGSGVGCLWYGGVSQLQ